MDDYIKLENEINKSKREYHTYTLPTEKIVKMVVKGLPKNIKIEEIKADLINKKLDVLNVKQFTKMEGNDGKKVEIKLPICTNLYR